MAFRSLFWKRDKSIIVIGGWFGENFADNPRILYEYLSNNKDKLKLKKVIWVSHNIADILFLRKQGYEAYDMCSPESIKYHKIAGIHIVNNSSSGNGDILGQYSYGTKRINLWHGTGFKGIGYCSNDFKEWTRNHKILYETYKYVFNKSKKFRKLVSKGGWADCFFLACGEREINILKSWFWLDTKKIILSNYPRHCKSNLIKNEEQNVINYINRYKGSILYLPTFRDEGSSFCPNDVANTLQHVLKEKNIVLIQKLHQASREPLVSNAENIISLPNNFDINIIMEKIDVLITDYSSCAFDAMYYRKRVIYYVPDIDVYTNGSNGFIENPLPWMVGSHIFDKQGLALEVNKLNFEKPYIPNRHYEIIRKELWSNEKEINEIWEDIKRVCDI